MSRVVRSSKFRHVFGTAIKRDLCYDGLRITRNAWDSNYCAVNPEFLAVALESGGGGAFIVLPLSKTGRVPLNAPKISGHKGQVLDIAWCPFNDHVIASCSDDCSIKIWEIPEGGLEKDYTQEDAAVELLGHEKKVGEILWHPTAADILVSSGFDFTIRVWNVSAAEQVMCIEGHTDTIYTMSWNRNGSLLATTCKDKLIRVVDPREGTIVQEGKGHDGSKASRCIFIDGNRIFTTGFSKMSERQYAVWDAGNLDKPLKMEMVDTASGVLFSFWDPDTRMVYVAGKGDGNIRYFEMSDEPPFAYYLSEYKSSAPQRGLGYMPKRGVDVANCEIARFYKLHSSGLVEPVSMTVPRKSDMFQPDLFPDTASMEPALTANEWLDGKNADPKLMSMKDKFAGAASSSARTAPSSGLSATKVRRSNTKPKAEPEEGTKENDEEADEPAADADGEANGDDHPEEQEADEEDKPAKAATPSASSSSGETERLKKEILELKKERDTLKKELQSVKAIVKGAVKSLTTV